MASMKIVLCGLALLAAIPAAAQTVPVATDPTISLLEH